MHTAILHIGSNVGNRNKYLSTCKFMLEDRVGKILQSSAIYRTEAWGYKEQSEFLNQAFKVETPLGLESLLYACQNIERLLNRAKDIKWGPRTIDIDIIFFDDLAFEQNHLCVPHPRMHLRNFVLYPVAEIIPEYIHPLLKKSVEELKNNSKDNSYVSI